MSGEFEVVRTLQAGVVVKGFDRRTKRNYDAVVNALRGEGCVAGGKRLMGKGGGNSSFCQRSFGGKWRMLLLFSGKRVAIIDIGEHSGDSGPVATLAEAVPEISKVGRKRGDQPRCCENPLRPPELSARARELFPF